MRINELIGISIAILALIFATALNASTTEFAGEVTGISFFAAELPQPAAR